MSSIAPNQGSVVGTTEAPRAAEPQYLSLNRVATYSSNNIVASISTRSAGTRAIAAVGSDDQNIASLEIDMAKYRDTAHKVSPPFPLTGTGSQFQ
ncbi:hypothetical protein FLONG3_1525 [Fusarium longipes]|uniref:Uncharacterized protein n=1 Tax=Fusarium longipes TaxID=694270 RepID=A0A395T7H1_9HYPO|nr:hypothetical protein FLONG3_1525 [Fusarium longipes]